MIKKKFGRRSVLKGMGAVVALPLLDAMVPALSGASSIAANAVPRMGFFYVPNGFYLPHIHPEGTGGKNFALSPILAAMDPSKARAVTLALNPPPKKKAKATK